MLLFSSQPYAWIPDMWDAFAEDLPAGDERRRLKGFERAKEIAQPVEGERQRAPQTWGRRKALRERLEGIEGVRRHYEEERREWYSGPLPVIPDYTHQP